MARAYASMIIQLVASLIVPTILFIASIKIKDEKEPWPKSAMISGLVLVLINAIVSGIFVFKLHTESYSTIMNNYHFIRMVFVRLSDFGMLLFSVGFLRFVISKK